MSVLLCESIKCKTIHLLKTKSLHKYLSGECTEEEKAEVERWLQKSPRNQEKMNDMKQIWDIPPGKRITVDPEDAWELFRSRVLETPKRSDINTGRFSGKGKKNPVYQLRNRQKGNNIRLMTYLAAIAAVFLVAFLFVYQSSQNSVPSEFEFSMQEITTEKGQRTNVRLSDGTRVQLNGDSKLMIPENFKDNHRIVTLEGEAYFEVVPGQSGNFHVYANNSVTRVLGTKFNVRAYPDDDSVEVVVAEGRVSMSTDENMHAPEVQLTQNQRGTLSRSGEVMAAPIEDASLYLGWTSGKLIFHNAPVQEVKRRLERWFDIEVVLVGDFSSNEKLLTGTFENVPLSLVLGSISLSLDLQFQQEGNHVVFTK